MTRFAFLAALAVACGSDPAHFAAGAPDASAPGQGGASTGGAAWLATGGALVEIEAGAGRGGTSTGGAPAEAGAGLGGVPSDAATAGAPSMGGTFAVVDAGTGGVPSAGGNAGASTGGTPATGGTGGTGGTGACPGGCSAWASWNEVDPAVADAYTCAVCPEGSELSSTEAWALYCDPGCIQPRVSASAAACGVGEYFCPKGCAMHFRCAANDWCLETGEPCP